MNFVLTSRISSRNRNLKVGLVVPDSPSLDCIVADRDVGELSVSVLLQNLYGLGEERKIAVMVDKSECRLYLLAAVRPCQHSPIGRNVIWRDLQRFRDIGDRVSLGAHLIGCFSAQDVTVSFRHRKLCGIVDRLA